MRPIDSRYAHLMSNQIVDLLPTGYFLIFGTVDPDIASVWGDCEFTVVFIPRVDIDAALKCGLHHHVKELYCRNDPRIRLPSLETVFYYFQNLMFIYLVRNR